MHEVAEQELFLKKDAFKEKMKQHRERIEGQQARPRVAFYNWLIERE
ncbi:MULTISPECIES: hypothetical protein [unclassified Sporosarcina]|nr:MULTISPECIES: hypothetical protein [unclassified Sporosarcina]